MEYRLIGGFRSLFDGRAYLHRRSNLGDSVALLLYEDIYAIGRSPKFISRVDEGLAVVNRQNRRHGVRARRGDGSFGEIIPNEIATRDYSFMVGRGPIATIELGVEVKTLMKAMIKQIDRVISDLAAQAAHFRARKGQPICVGVVGVNHAPVCASYEAERVFRTDGRRYKHPSQEAADAIARLLQYAAPHFDEFIILPFAATNEAPFKFAWVNERQTSLDYGAALVRISRQYETSI